MPAGVSSGSGHPVPQNPAEFTIGSHAVRLVPAAGRNVRQDSSCHAAQADVSGAEAPEFFSIGRRENCHLVGGCITCMNPDCHPGLTIRSKNGRMTKNGRSVKEYTVTDRDCSCCGWNIAVAEARHRMLQERGLAKRREHFCLLLPSAAAGKARTVK